MTGLFLLLGCGFFVGLLLFAESRGDRTLKWVAKPAASAIFVALAHYNGASDTPFGRAIFVGLILCAIGDILLIVQSKRLFLAGMAAFAVGYLSYIAAFATTGPEWSARIVLAAALSMAAVTVFLRVMWRNLANLRSPVAAYAVIIAAMVTAAANLGDLPAASGPASRVIAAALLFAISDIAVARDQFIEHRFVNKLWGLPLYYGAQMLFASSV